MPYLHDFLIILSAALAAACCGLLGCYLMLRRMVMSGDAISHAVLPGIVIAYLVSGSRTSFSAMLGAMVFGVLCTFLIEFLHRRLRIQEDASIGVVFTFLFAVGIILLSLFAGQVDLDQDCVLNGELTFVPIDVWIYEGNVMGPRAVWILGALLAALIIFIKMGYKELLITTFDAEYASSIGINTTLWHYLLMGTVSATTVLSFELLGSILVVAFMTIPPATAYLLTNKLSLMFLITIAVGSIAAVAGYGLAKMWDTSVAGSITVVMGIIFAAVLQVHHIARSKKVVSPEET
ncbi:MAG: metal ABC transporter permease [Sphingobacteriales bacterium]|nr:metal ABC transporter permease [Sphingobacteriales bacterium]